MPFLDGVVMVCLRCDSLTQHTNPMKTILLGFLPVMITSFLCSKSYAGQNMCLSHRDESKPQFIKCNAQFMNGSLVSITDFSTGYTFRAGENGWIPAAGNCLQNLESGSKIRLNNLTELKHLSNEII